MDAVMSQSEGQKVSGIGDLLLRADTDPGAGPNFLVFEIGKNFRTIGCRWQGLRTSERPAGSRV